MITVISSEHSNSLRTCAQVRRKLRKCDVVYACEKKTRPKWPCLAFDLTQRSLHLAGAARVLTVVLSGDHLTSSPFLFLGNVMHCSGQVWRMIVSNRKGCESPFSSPLLRLWGFRLVRRQRQCKYRVWYSVKPLVVARVAARFPADEQLIDCEFFFFILFYFIIFLCLCLCLPFANHGRSALSSATKYKKSDEKERLRENNWRARRQLSLVLYRMRYWFMDRKRPLLFPFRFCCARRPLHMRRRKGGGTSSRLTHVSDGSFGRTLQSLRDAASVLALTLKIFGEGPSLSLRKGESAYLYGDGKQTDSGACHGEALPSRFLLWALGSVVCMASQHAYGGLQATVAFALNSCRERTDPEYRVDHCNQWNTQPLITTTSGLHPKYSLLYALKGWEKNFHTHALTDRLPNHHLVRCARSEVIWRPPLRAGAWNFNYCSMSVPKGEVNREGSYLRGSWSRKYGVM